MSWVMLFVGLAFAGLVVIAACAVKVFAAVLGLARELQRTRRRLAPKRAALYTAVQRLERHGSEPERRTAYDQERTGHC